MNEEQKHPPLLQWQEIIYEVHQCLCDLEARSHNDCIRDLERLVANMKQFYSQDT